MEDVSFSKLIEFLANDEPIGTDGAKSSDKNTIALSSILPPTMAATIYHAT